MMSIDNIPASTYTDKDFTQNISKNFGGNFLWSNYCERDYIASLLIVMSKRLDLQRAFGFGPKTQYKTGNTVSASFLGKIVSMMNQSMFSFKKLVGRSIYAWRMWTYE